MNRQQKDRSILDDKKLIESFQSNDEKAFDQLVLKYQDMVFNICYRFLGNYDDADDSAQETFVKVYKNLSRFKFESHFSTWLYRIAVNTCKSKLSSIHYRFGKTMIPIDKPKNCNNGIYPMEIKDETYLPEKMIEEKEMKLMIHSAIDSLPEKQKTLVVLRDIEGLPYEEIVQITGLKLGTVKSKLARARQSLVIKLSEVI